MKYTNYSIGEILAKKNKGVNTPEMVSLYEEVEKYKSTMERRVDVCVRTIKLINPDNKMRWIQENAPLDIRQYVCCAVLGKEVNVLMRSEKKWKTVADLGLDVEESGSLQEYIEEWFAYWNKQAETLSALNVKVYESHAHYNLKNFNVIRERLLPLMNSSGVKKIIIPAVGFSTNSQMIKLFDKPEYEYVKYAFGLHPKYLWKENWNKGKWDDFRALLNNPKCVAIGETGLDYSYSGICNSHRLMQMEMFSLFIEEANQHSLPMILHIRPSDDADSFGYNAGEDAMGILAKNKVNAGAILHCFGGTISDVQRYMDVGVNAFGIGGRIIYGNAMLERAVAYMPETVIILETDAPYIKVDGGRAPNTSLSLLAIAQKVAELRGTTTEHILEVSYKNAEKLFDK